MASPPRMVELECPNCQHPHWEIDCDSRGADIKYCLGISPTPHELSYEERTYHCPACNQATVGYRVLQKSPIEFFLQPHPMRPMTTRDFAHWLSVFRAQFPSHDLLKTVGVFWYPGEVDEEQESKMRKACEVGMVEGYRLSLSNRSPDDERIRVGVERGMGVAHFWCHSGVDLDRCDFGFEEDELQKIRELLATKTSEIGRAWQRFSSEAKKAQARWLPKLLGPAGG